MVPGGLWWLRLCLSVLLASNAATALLCKGNCTSYGTCYEDIGRCDCPKDRKGVDCRHALAEDELLVRCSVHTYTSGEVAECQDPRLPCLNSCTGAGKCMAGWCHCDPGFFGMDCALSLGEDGRPHLLAHESAPYATRAKRPWVYVYDLPGRISTWNSARRLDRLTHIHFTQRLLGSGARVADGDLADWYFIPVRLRTVHDSHFFVSAVQHIIKFYPWFNRTQGHRHFVIHTGDWGRSETAPEVRAIGANVTWLTHWGLEQDRPAQMWNASHRREQDVVIPVFISPSHFQRFGMDATPLHPRYTRGRGVQAPGSRTPRQRGVPPATPARNLTLFFAGSICGDRRPPEQGVWPNCFNDSLAYSGGVRQKVHYHHWNRTGFHVVHSEPRYGRYMASSRYCLAPPGAGHGQRQIQSVFGGCVPVTIGDHILEPWEPVLDWGGFGVRVAEADIPRLHEVLEGISPEEYARKQAGLRCAAQHLAYSSVTGGFLGEDGRWDAFETALEVMRVMAEHPGARPDQYRKLDAAFDDFMACRTKPRSNRGAGARQAGEPVPNLSTARAPLCSHSRFDAQREGAVRCSHLLRATGRFGPPGGAMCAGLGTGLAGCPRLWA